MSFKIFLFVQTSCLRMLHCPKTNIISRFFPLVTILHARQSNCTFGVLYLYFMSWNNQITWCTKLSFSDWTSVALWNRPQEDAACLPSRDPNQFLAEDSQICECFNKTEECETWPSFQSPGAEYNFTITNLKQFHPCSCSMTKVSPVKANAHVAWEQAQYTCNIDMHHTKFHHRLKWPIYDLHPVQDIQDLVSQRGTKKRSNSINTNTGLWTMVVKIKNQENLTVIIPSSFHHRSNVNRMGHQKGEDILGEQDIGERP